MSTYPASVGSVKSQIPRVRNIDDRKWVFWVMENLVGVNGIDPVRQGIVHPPKDPDRYSRLFRIGCDAKFRSLFKIIQDRL